MGPHPSQPGLALFLSGLVAIAPASAWANPSPEPFGTTSLSGSDGPKPFPVFRLPPPDEVLSAKTPLLQNNGYCGDFLNDVGAGLVRPIAGIVALLAIVGWCGGTLAGADELARGDLEQGMLKTGVAAVLGGFVGWGVAYELARQNRVPQPENELWQATGAAAGVGTSLLVGLGGFGLRMWLGPPAEKNPQEDRAKERRRRSKRRSR